MNKTIRNLLIVVAVLLVANFLVTTCKPKIVVSPYGEIFRMWPGGTIDELDRADRRWVSQEQRIAEREKARAEQEIAAAEQEMADLEESEQAKVNEIAKYNKLLLDRDEIMERIKKQGKSAVSLSPDDVFDAAYDRLFGSDDEVVLKSILRRIQDYEIFWGLTGQTFPRETEQ